MLLLTAAGAALAASSGTRGGSHTQRRLRQGAAVLAGSVLFDSAMEHFRGGWHDRKMYAAPAVATVSLAASMRAGLGAAAGHVTALATGLAGTFFHFRNVARKPGGFCWNNLFYSSPLGAPAALSLAGLFGLFAERLGARGVSQTEQVADGRGLAAAVGLALWGETAEVGLLHLRGAFHDPFMVAPLVVAPLTGTALLAQAAVPGGRFAVRPLLRATTALGLIGTGFHLYGVSRNMGGWGNWRQTALAGPPVPAPISFTGIALAGAAALHLLSGRDDDRNAVS